MRQVTITKTYYKFDELSEKAQENAIEKLYDLNVDYDWWDCIYEDAARIGLKIMAFDIDGGFYVKGGLTASTEDCAKAILDEHGESCDTYQLAKHFLANLDAARKKAKAEDPEFEEDYCAEIDELKDEFERALKEEYRAILRKEFDYLTSKEAIKESIYANDYEFDEKGVLQ